MLSTSRDLRHGPIDLTAIPPDPSREVLVEGFSNVWEYEGEALIFIAYGDTGLSQMKGDAFSFACVQHGTAFSLQI